MVDRKIRGGGQGTDDGGENGSDSEEGKNKRKAQQVCHHCSTITRSEGKSRAKEMTLGWREHLYDSKLVQIRLWCELDANLVEESTIAVHYALRWRITRFCRLYISDLFFLFRLPPPLYRCG